jgi:WYL domain
MANTLHLRHARFRAIETLLLWEGEVGNARLRRLFGLQLQQASRLLAEYRAAFPKQTEWDKRRRVYRATGKFKPRFADGSLEVYGQLLFSQEVPTIIEDARLDFTAAAPSVFAKIYRACADGSGLQIAYGSMSHPSGIERVIFPHHLVRVGRRWHTRAWCCLRRDFRDFTLGRIGSVTPVATPRPISPDDDRAWTRRIELRIVAHSGLAPEQAKVIRKEYFSGTAARRISVRECLAPYVIQDLRAAVDPKRERPPEYQLQIADPKSVSTLVFAGTEP